MMDLRQIAEEWLAEAERRARELDEGTAKPISAEEVRRKVAAILGNHSN
jgi:hypothetical protein